MSRLDLEEGVLVARKKDEETAAEEAHVAATDAEPGESRGRREQPRSTPAPPKRAGATAG